MKNSFALACFACLQIYACKSHVISALCSIVLDILASIHVRWLHASVQSHCAVTKHHQSRCPKTYRFTCRFGQAQVTLCTTLMLSKTTSGLQSKQGRSKLDGSLLWNAYCCCVAGHRGLLKILGSCLHLQVFEVDCKIDCVLNFELPDFVKW